MLLKLILTVSILSFLSACSSNGGSGGEDVPPNLTLPSPMPSPTPIPLKAYDGINFEGGGFVATLLLNLTTTPWIQCQTVSGDITSVFQSDPFNCTHNRAGTVLGPIKDWADQNSSPNKILTNSTKTKAYVDISTQDLNNNTLRKLLVTDGITTTDITGPDGFNGLIGLLPNGKVVYINSSNFVSVSDGTNVVASSSSVSSIDINTVAQLASGEILLKSPNGLVDISADGSGVRNYEVNGGIYNYSVIAFNNSFYYFDKSGNYAALYSFSSGQSLLVKQFTDYSGNIPFFSGNFDIVNSHLMISTYLSSPQPYEYFSLDTSGTLSTLAPAQFHLPDFSASVNFSYKGKSYFKDTGLNLVRTDGLTTPTTVSSPNLTIGYISLIGQANGKAYLFGYDTNLSVLKLLSLSRQIDGSDLITVENVDVSSLSIGSANQIMTFGTMAYIQSVTQSKSPFGEYSPLNVYSSTINTLDLTSLNFKSNVANIDGLGSNGVNVEQKAILSNGILIQFMLSQLYGVELFSVTVPMQPNNS